MPKYFVHVTHEIEAVWSVEADSPEAAESKLMDVSTREGLWSHTTGRSALTRMLLANPGLQPFGVELSTIELYDSPSRVYRIDRIDPWWEEKTNDIARKQTGP